MIQFKMLEVALCTGSQCVILCFRVYSYCSVVVEGTGSCTVCIIRYATGLATMAEIIRRKGRFDRYAD